MMVLASLLFSALVFFLTAEQLALAVQRQMEILQKESEEFYRLSSGVMRNVNIPNDLSEYVKLLSSLVNVSASSLIVLIALLPKRVSKQKAHSQQALEFLQNHPDIEAQLLELSSAALLAAAVRTPLVGAIVFALVRRKMEKRGKSAVVNLGALHLLHTRHMSA
ncbi:hypothetical protein [Flexibacterium corallicola]|uniref:hypothetical protein n=1 Tax=Flexibacterium corallicola TaxID=3037259 RepID=UPI00286F09D6|nr:hypothetical protein [Pseudovibrio sp. M1P-2-3]